MQLFLNNWDAYLDAPAAPDDLSLTVTPEAAAALGEIPQGDHVVATLEGEEGIEIVHITGVSGATLTVERAQEGTPALFWPVRTMFQARTTAGTLRALQAPPGGGSSARFGKPRLPTGQSFCPYQIAASSSEFAQSFLSGQIRAVPFELDYEMAVGALGVYVGTAKSSTWVQIAIYSSDADGWPDQRLDMVEISAASAGHRVADISQPRVLQPGQLYWLAIRPTDTVSLRSAACAVIGPPGTTGSNSSLTRVAAQLPESWEFTSADFAGGLPSPLITIRRG